MEKNISIVLSLYVYIYLYLHFLCMYTWIWWDCKYRKTTQSWGVCHFVQDLCLDDSALCWHSNWESVHVDSETAWVLAQQTFRNHPNSGANSDTTKRPFVKSKDKSKFTFFNCHQRCLQRSCSPSADSVDSGVPNHRSWRPRGCSMRPTRPEDCAMAPRWAWRRQRPCCGGLDGCEDMWRLTCKLRGDKVIYVGWRQIPTERFAMDVYIYVYLHHYAANGLILINQRVVLGAIWLEHLWARRNRTRM